MTVSPLGALVATLAAVLCLGAGVALALSRTRADMLQAFSTGGFFAGVATMALGEGTVGAGVIGACAALSLILSAAARRVGEMAPSRETPFWIKMAFVGAALIVALSVWRGAPAAQGAGAPADRGPNAHVDTIFAAPDGGALFAALALLLGVAGIAGALLGRGERGVLGADPIHDEPGAHT